jgi:hypothetical protein
MDWLHLKDEIEKLTGKSVAKFLSFDEETLNYVEYCYDEPVVEKDYKGEVEVMFKDNTVEVFDITYSIEKFLRDYNQRTVVDYRICNVRIRLADEKSGERG